MNVENLPDIVYHGTISIYKKSLLDGINLKKGNECVDFGQGFYTTTNLEQAKYFSITQSKKNNIFQESMKSRNNEWIPRYSNPLIIGYKINKVLLKKYYGLFFSNCDVRWAEFIYNNRLGIDFLISNYHNIDKKYDFIYGFMADADIANIIQDVKLRKIDFDRFAEAIQPFDQYSQDQLSFHTKNVLQCIEYAGDINLRKDD